MGHAGSEEADEVVERLRQEIDDEVGASVDYVTNDLDGLLGGVRAEAFAPDVQMALDAILERGEAVDVRTRDRLIRASERALRYRQAMTGPLQLLLEGRRFESAVDLGALAEKLGMEPDAFRDLERGARELEEVGAEKIATWIVELDVETEPAMKALRRSLLPAESETLVASDVPDAEFVAEAEQFIAQVKTELEHRRLVAEQ